MSKEICICAAIKDTTGYIWRGHRHANCIALAIESGREIPLSMKDAMAISGLKDTRVAMEHYAYSTPEGQAKILAKTK